MRRINLLLLTMIIPAALSAQSSFTVKGTFKDMKIKATKVYMSYKYKGEDVTDSSKVIDGKYYFKGMIDEPNLAHLTINSLVFSMSEMGAGDNGAIRASDLFLEKSNITVLSENGFGNDVVTGSVSHKEYKLLLAALEPCMGMGMKDDEISKRRFSGDTVGLHKQIIEDMNASWRCRRGVLKNYVLSNPTSPIVVYALNRYAGDNVDEDVAALFKDLPENAKTSPKAKELAKRINAALNLAIGKPALAFTQTDTAGKPVSLSSFRGKYVLIDFWASWCGPCRRENPNLIVAYNKFKDKGFEVLGISLDYPGHRKNWLDAIKQDKLTWTQLSDLKGWNNEVSSLYGVEGVPQNFLIDPNGIIVAKNLKGEKLEEALAAIFNK